MLLKAGGTHFQIAEFFKDKVVLEHLHTHQKKLIPEALLTEQLLNGEVARLTDEGADQNPTGIIDSNVTSAIEARHASRASVNRMTDQARWIAALRSCGVTKIANEPWIRIEIEKLAASKMMGVPRFQISTLAKVERKLAKSSGDVTVLLPHFERRGGKGKTRLDPETETIISEEIRKVVARPGVFIKDDVVDAVRTRVIEMAKATPATSLALPGASTIRRRIARCVPEYDIRVKRYGKKDADRMYREHGNRDTAEVPLEVSETDDIDAGVFLIDSRTELPCGRAFLTSSIDQYDQVPMGFDLSHLHRSTESAVNCILDGLLPKDQTRPEFAGQRGAWVGYGTAGINIMDNASYNHTSDTERVQLNLKQSFGWAKPQTPTNKSTIENFNGIIKRSFCPRLEGWVGDDDNPDGNKRGMEGAIMDIATFKREFVTWVVDVYLNSPGVDGLTPRQRRESFFRDFKPMVRWSRDQLDFMRLQCTQLRFRASGGLLWLQLRYQSDELAEIRRLLKPNAQVTVYASRQDLSHLIVLHPYSSALIKVPCIEDSRYFTGLTDRQQRLVLEQARSMGIRNPAIAECVRARQELAQRTEKLRHDRRLRRRQKGMQNHIDPMAGHVSISPDTFRAEIQVSTSVREVYVSDLEHAVNELDQIDISGMDWNQAKLP